MNILQIFSKVPYPPKDGGSVAVTTLTEGFVKSGNKVTLLCLNTKKHFVETKKVIPLLPENVSYISVYVDTDIKISKLIKNFIFSGIPYIAERFISDNFRKKLIETLKNEHFDLIQIEGLYMMPYIEDIRKFSKAIIIFRAHNIEHEIWKLNLKREKNVLKKIYLANLVKRLRKFEISFINKYDAVIPITKRDAGIFNELGNKKPLYTAPAGINFKKYDTKQQDFSGIKLYHLGSLDWAPNTEGLLWFLKNVWVKFSEKYPSYKFIIAGRNASPGFVNKIKSYKNTDFRGEIENATDFMNRHNVIIVPLLSGSGMRIKIIEAMACGNVVISTSKGAEGINAENGKEILVADTPEEFMKQITGIISDKEKAEKISLAAKRFISLNFDNFAITKKLLNFYEDLIL